MRALISVITSVVYGLAGMIVVVVQDEKVKMFSKDAGMWFVIFSGFLLLYMFLFFKSWDELDGTLRGKIASVISILLTVAQLFNKSDRLEFCEIARSLVVIWVGVWLFFTVVKLFLGFFGIAVGGICSGASRVSSSASSYVGNSVYNAMSGSSSSSASADAARRQRQSDADRRARERWNALDRQKKAEWDAMDAAKRGKDIAARQRAQDAQYWKNQAR